MYTQCPYCQTLFRVRAEQLRLAQGQAHCSHCHGIFNALQHLKESPAFEEEEEWPESLLIDPLEPNPAPPPEPPVSEPEESFSTAEETVPGIVVAFASEDEDPAIEIERPVEEQTRPLHPDEKPEELFAPSHKHPPIISSPEPEPLPLEASEKERRPKRKGSPLWTLGTLLLLGLALLQTAWLTREQLIRYPQGRLALETLCRYAGCQLPEQRAPRRIEVLRRSITVHPTEDNALLIELTLANRAAFAQPYPQLQIALYDNNETLVAQRRFRPSQYLARPVTKSERLEPNQALSVELEVADPGNNVTGFKLEFF